MDARPIWTRSAASQIRKAGSVLNTSIDRSVTCRLNLDKPIITRKTKTFRKIKNIDTAALSYELAASDLCSNTPDDLNDLVHCYNTTLASALDRHAPLVTRSIPVRPLVPWFNNYIKK